MLDLIPFSATGASASPETPSACWIASSVTATPPSGKIRSSAGCRLSLSSGAKPAWLPANLGRDFYRKQAETHIESLALKIANLQLEIEDRAGNLLDERDRMIQQRLWLQNELDNVGAG